MAQPNDPSLQAALQRLAQAGQPPLRVPLALDARFEVAEHYARHFATSPATSRSGDEPCVLYENVHGGMPVLMGLFGARRRNEWLLHGEAGRGAWRLAQHLAERLPCATVREAPCHEVVRPEKLAALPILTATRLDAGPYLTSGLVCARDPDTGAANISIHRMRVLDAERLTIWMLPGRDLDRMHQKALARGQGLPVSISIGAPPAVYLVSSLSAPFIGAGESELELAGAVLGHPVRIASCASNGAFCIADSEIVIEGEITAERAAEFSDPDTRWAMPEFLGYMGQGRSELPVLRVTQVSHRRGAVFQAFLGPGKEQSELLALPTEAGLIAQLNPALAGEFTVLDAHCLAPAGGQLVVALSVRKHRDAEGGMRRLLDAVLARHKLAKAVWVVDDDVDIHSSEDLLWAASTRFQPGRDLHLRRGEPGFPLDPSQGAGYLDPQGQQPLTDKYLLDLTVPLSQRSRFLRMPVHCATEPAAPATATPAASLSPLVEFAP